ncbi:hypothetical protein ACJ8PQ_03405, partial [Serratia sp. CY74664]
ALGALAGAFDVVQDPLHLGAGEVRVNHQPILKKRGFSSCRQLATYTIQSGGLYSVSDSTSAHKFK